MNRDDILHMARESGFHVTGMRIWAPVVGSSDLSALLERFAALVEAVVLAKLARQKPVAWFHPETGMNWLVDRKTIAAFTRFYAAPVPAVGQEPVARDELLQDLERHQRSIVEMGDRLTAIVNLIRGEPPEGASHSTHDAVELVRNLLLHHEQYVLAAEHEIRGLKDRLAAPEAPKEKP